VFFLLERFVVPCDTELNVQL